VHGLVRYIETLVVAHFLDHPVRWSFTGILYRGAW